MFLVGQMNCCEIPSGSRISNLYAAGWKNKFILLKLPFLQSRTMLIFVEYRMCIRLFYSHSFGLVSSQNLNAVPHTFNFRGFRGEKKGSFSKHLRKTCRLFQLTGELMYWESGVQFPTMPPEKTASRCKPGLAAQSLNATRMFFNMKLISLNIYFIRLIVEIQQKPLNNIILRTYSSSNDYVHMFKNDDQ